MKHVVRVKMADGSMRVISERQISIPRKSLEEAGRAHWTSLHQAGISGTLTLEWFVKWEKDIPSFGCSCRRTYEEKIKPSHPFRPDFAFTVELHNAVNAELEKPILTIEEARAIWTR